MKPTVENYLHFAMYDKSVRFSPDELMEAYRKVVCDMVREQEFQIQCHQDGSYGKPPNQKKIDLIIQDVNLLKSYLEAKSDENAQMEKSSRA
jgi:hypothetical protein